MTRTTWDWTKRFVTGLALLVLVLGTSGVGLTRGGWVGIALLVAVDSVAVLSLLVPAWSGAVIGLAAAAGLVAVRRHFGAWTSADFDAAAVESLALVTVGAVAGALGTMLRSRERSAVAQGTAGPAPAYGSLGLLGRDAALTRIEEEVERAARSPRPLTLALVDVDTRQADMPRAARQTALRTTARLLEGRVRDLDVPFALTAEQLGVLFPDSPPEAAWDLVGELMSALGTTTYLEGRRRRGRRLSDVVALRAGIVQYRAGQDWEAFLDEAITALEQGDPDERPSASPFTTRGEAR